LTRWLVLALCMVTWAPLTAAPPASLQAVHAFAGADGAWGSLTLLNRDSFDPDGARYYGTVFRFTLP